MSHLQFLQFLVTLSDATKNRPDLQLSSEIPQAGKTADETKRTLLFLELIFDGQALERSRLLHVCEGVLVGWHLLGVYLKFLQF